MRYRPGPTRSSDGLPTRRTRPCWRRPPPAPTTSPGNGAPTRWREHYRKQPGAGSVSSTRKALALTREPDLTPSPGSVPASLLPHGSQPAVELRLGGVRYHPAIGGAEQHARRLLLEIGDR